MYKSLNEFEIRPDATTGFHAYSIPVDPASVRACVPP